MYETAEQFRGDVRVGYAQVRGRVENAGAVVAGELWEQLECTEENVLGYGLNTRLGKPPRSACRRIMCRANAAPLGSGARIPRNGLQLLWNIPHPALWQNIPLL